MLSIIKHGRFDIAGLIVGGVLLAGLVTVFQIAPASALDPPKVYPVRPSPPSQPSNSSSSRSSGDILDLDVTKPIPLDDATTRPLPELRIDPPAPVLRTR